jgi:methanogenic corrinoid protein MtbC1
MAGERVIDARSAAGSKKRTTVKMVMVSTSREFYWFADLPDDITNTITGAMHQIGDLWFKGSITVADEHLATRVVLSALQTLSAAMMPVPPSGLKAICCGIEGDLHELPVQLARIILESGRSLKRVATDKRRRTQIKSAFICG